MGDPDIERPGMQDDRVGSLERPEGGVDFGLRAIDSHTQLEARGSVSLLDQSANDRVMNNHLEGRIGLIHENEHSRRN